MMKLVLVLTPEIELVLAALPQILIKHSMMCVVFPASDFVSTFLKQTEVRNSNQGIRIEVT